MILLYDPSPSCNQCWQVSQFVAMLNPGVQFRFLWPVLELTHKNWTVELAYCWLQNQSWNPEGKKLFNIGSGSLVLQLNIVLEKLATVGIGSWPCAKPYSSNRFHFKHSRTPESVQLSISNNIQALQSLFSFLFWTTFENCRFHGAFSIEQEHGIFQFSQTWNVSWRIWHHADPLEIFQGWLNCNGGITH